MDDKVERAIAIIKARLKEIAEEERRCQRALKALG